MEIMARLLDDALTLLSVVYGLALNTYLVLRTLFGERFGLIGLANSFHPWLLLPSFVLVPLNFIRRRFAVGFGLLSGVTAFVAAYGDRFLPKAEARQVYFHTDHELAILTFNTQAQKCADDRILTVIRETNADVVALQELAMETAEHIRAELTDLYPFQALHPHPRTTAGQGFLSRIPILDDEYWHNRYVPEKFGHQRVQIQIDSEIITFYNIHPVHPGLNGSFYNDEDRAEDIGAILARAETEPGSVILLGDFNMADQSDDYERITARYHDTFRETGYGLGLTFPDFESPCPDFVFRSPIRLLRLDYIFYRGALRALESRVWHTSGGSDHRPLFGRLALETHKDII
jgi:vancomycin resistance protein VanJ